MVTVLAKLEEMSKKMDAMWSIGLYPPQLRK
jgi:hypothetical protein